VSAPTFPLLDSYGKERRELERLGAPRFVPWALVAPHEAQALRNHGQQNLARLAERGGLGLCELAAVLADRRWHPMPAADALAFIRARLAAYEAAGAPS
jgi:hypothetical protein